jgi:anti-sigma-K factor RskA
MDLLTRPELLDRIAAAYALGTLRGGARRRFEALARQSPQARAAALLWQERLIGLTELQAVEVPSPNVWKRIENLLERPAHRAGQAGPLRLWRIAAWGGALATVAAVAVSLNLARVVDQQERQLAQARLQAVQLAQRNTELMAQLQAQPEIRYVAVLADDKAAASLLAMFDPKHNTLMLKRVGSFQEGPEKSLQLWAVPAAGGPQSLGVLGPDAVMRLPAAEQHLRQVPLLAVSREPKGGAPAGSGPTGPVLFKGAVLQTPL